MKIEDIYYHVRQPKDPKDFWEVNQELSYIEPFAALKKNKIGYKIMTAIYMIYDPKSQVVNSGLSTEEVKKDISKNYLGDENFPWSDYNDVVIAYKKYTKTKIESEIDSMYFIIKERRQAAEDLDWIDDFDTKDKIISSHDDYLKKYQNLVASLKEERQEKLMHGDYTPSMLELWSIVE